MIVCLSFPLFAAVQGQAKDIQPTRRVTYKTVGDIELQLHVFEPAQQSDCPRAAVVLFFGGGWSMGTPKQFYHQCQYFADQGMVAISAEYRTKRNGGVEPAECVKDGKAAIRYVRKHAKALSVDPKRIVAGGGSAGGHVAAAAGTVEGFEHEGQDLLISARPDALVLFNPVYDNSQEGYGYDRVKEYWKEFSPRHNIDKNTPPMIVFFGSEEEHVKIPVAKAIQKEMKELELKSELFIYDGQRHGFFNYGKDGNKWFILTLTESHKFLADLGFLSGEPAVKEYLAK